MIRKRSQAREIALQFLYRAELRKDEVMPELEEFLDESGAGEPTRRFARELVEGALAKKDEIDRVLGEAARNWKISRMAIIDRLILRLGAYELLFLTETPHAVVINEAVDLAKKFSTVASGAFVNGILDSITKQVHKADN